MCVCVCVVGFIPNLLVVQQTIVRDGGQAFQQSHRVVRGDVFSPTTQADQETEPHIKHLRLVQIARA